MTKKSTKKHDKIPTKKNIEDILMTVYDPEFPIVDIFTLWLIYDITIDSDKYQIFILMTLTSPACPLWDQIMEWMREAINSEFPWFGVEIELTFDPLWSPDSILDQDLKRMFEV